MTKQNEVQNAYHERLKKQGGKRLTQVYTKPQLAALNSVKDSLNARSYPEAIRKLILNELLRVKGIAQDSRNAEYKALQEEYELFNDNDLRARKALKAWDTKRKK